MQREAKFVVLAGLILASCSPEGRNLGLDQAEVIGTFPFAEVEFVREVPFEAGRAMHPSADGAAFTDRVVYFSDDQYAHVLVSFLGHPLLSPTIEPLSCRLEVELGGAIAASYTLPVANDPVTGLPYPKLEVVLDISQFAGTPILRATLLRGPIAASVSVPLTVEPGGWTQPSFPTAVPLTVDRTVAPGVSAYPISAGVPFPLRMLRESDLSHLGLFEEQSPGVWARVEADFTVRGSWQPGPNSPVRWLGVDFVAHFNSAGDPFAYEIRDGQSAPATTGPITCYPSSPSNPRFLVVTRTDGGPPPAAPGTDQLLRVAIPTTSFTGVSRLHRELNGSLGFSPTELILDAQNDGPYIVAAGDPVPYRAAMDADVEVEQLSCGRVAARFRARGAYARCPGGASTCSPSLVERLHRFITYITVFYGVEWVDITHSTVLTSPTEIADAGWAGVVDTVQDLHMGGEGIPSAGCPTGPVFSFPTPGIGSSVFLHQDRGTRFRVNDGASDCYYESPGRAQGWGEARRGYDSSAGFVLRDMRERFPNELAFEGVSGGVRASVHFWPRHGHDAFSAAEINAPDALYRLLHAHSGSSTQWGAVFPSAPVADPAAPGASILPTSPDMVGLAFTGSFAVYGRRTSLTSAVGIASAVSRRPHAIPSSEWVADSGVFGAIAAAGAASTPGFIDARLSEDLVGYRRMIQDDGEEYGMWTYGDMHQNWDPATDLPRAHRVWTGGHYRHPWTAWMLYARSGSADLRDWAQWTTDTYADRQIIHASTTIADAPCAGPARVVGPGYERHVVEEGEVVPWDNCESVGTRDHWISPSALAMRYYLTGDLRALDLLRQWGAALGAEGAGTTSARGSLREPTTVLGEVVEYYMATHDPNALTYLRQSACGCGFAGGTTWTCTASSCGLGALQSLATPAFTDRDMYSFHTQWYRTYYTLTRDPRLLAQVDEFLEGGHSDFGVAAFRASISGDYTRVESLRGEFIDRLLERYFGAGERYDGYSMTEAIPERAGLLAEAPFFLEALAHSAPPLSGSPAVLAGLLGARADAPPPFPRGTVTHLGGDPLVILLPAAGGTRAFDTTRLFSGWNAHYALGFEIEYRNSWSGTASLLGSVLQTSYGGGSLPAPPTPADLAWTAVAAPGYGTPLPWRAALSGSVPAGTEQIRCWGRCALARGWVTASGTPVPEIFQIADTPSTTYNLPGRHTLFLSTRGLSGTDPVILRFRADRGSSTGLHDHRPSYLAVFDHLGAPVQAVAATTGVACSSSGGVPVETDEYGGTSLLWQGRKEVCFVLERTGEPWFLYTFSSNTTTDAGAVQLSLQQGAPPVDPSRLPPGASTLLYAARDPADFAAVMP